jgi:glycosyltransferase involved in cell wall biosynthesis
VREALRVGVLADTVDQPGGIGRYVREVLAAAGDRDDVRLVVATPRASVPTVERLAGGALEDVVTPPASGQVPLALWDRERAGPALARHGARVVIGCKHLVPRAGPPSVLVVHDLLTLTRRHENALAKRVLLPHFYRASLARAQALVAVSEATRGRLAAMRADWAAKCTVVPNGMSTHLLGATPERPAGLGDRAFALVVGDLSPRKNVGLLTSTWEQGAPGDLHLVVVGPEPAGADAVADALRRLEARGTATWIRGADDRVLRWCYERARVVVLPTFEEGFGLPLLEARAFAAPVIASTDPALREVARDDPLVTHLDPHDAAAWRTAIGRAAAVPRAVVAPAVPLGAITWREHTERLLAVARSVAA